MTKIKQLTPEQEEQLRAAVEEWRAVGLSCEPADRPRAEAAWAAMYRDIGEDAPRFLWFRSPAMAMLGGAMLGDQLGDQLGGQLRDQLRGQLRGQLRDQLRGQLRDQLRGQLRDQLDWSYFRGQQEAYWVSYYDWPARALGVRYSNDQHRRLDLWCEIALSANWWWPYRGVVIASERPLRVAFDDARRLHSEAGPAVVYPDGWGVWAWHGVRVPATVIDTSPDEITAAMVIGERNAEIRRVLMERMGTERLIERLGATECGTDDWGTLLRIARPDDTPYVAVRVVNASPELDGSFREYLLRVPPEFGSRAKNVTVSRAAMHGGGSLTVPRTPHAAIAWTFGLDPDDYRPMMAS